MMRWTPCYLLTLCLLLTSAYAQSPVTQPAQPPATQPIYVLNGTLYTGYTVSTDVDPANSASFMVIQNQSDLDKTFASSAVMDESHRLPPHSFDTNLVVAVVKRGGSIWDFTLKDVLERNGVVLIRYTTTENKQTSGKFASPMILSIPKGNYAVIEFEEDGKVVKRLIDQSRARRLPTTTEAKAKVEIERQIEKKLGRPLTPDETKMIDVTESGGRINVAIHQPLTGRLRAVMHPATTTSTPTTVPTTSP